MPVQYFVLDSTHPGYAAARIRLAFHDGNKVSFTPTQVVRDCAHDPTLKVVRANITEAELDGDPDLVDLRTANYSTELCRTRYTFSEFRVRGFQVLGESIRSNIGQRTGETGRKHYFVRRKTRQASGTGAGPGYGDATGETHYDALDGLDSNGIGAAFLAGHSYALCGSHVRERLFNPTVSHEAENMVSFPTGDISATPFELRMDHPLDPGMLAAGLQVWNVGGNNWTQDGVNSDAWSLSEGADFAGGIAVYLDPMKRTTDFLTQNVLEEVSSLAEVRATAWSWWRDGTGPTTYVNIPGGADPRFNIGFSSFGNSPGFDLRSAMCHATSANGYEFVNCQILNAGDLGQPTTKLPKAKFLGGRWLLGSSFFPEDMPDGVEWGWSEDGDICFDVSDRPDPDTDADIAKAKAKAVAKGVDPTGWAYFDRFIELAAVDQGIYEEGAGTGKSGHDSIVKGCYQWGIGHYVDAARNLSYIPTNPGVPDGHCVAHQGLDGWHVSYVYLDKGRTTAGGGPNQSKTAISLYSTTDSTGAQNLRNNVIEHFVTKGYGINLIGDGGSYLRANGDGLYDGNVIRYGCIRAIPADGEGTLFGSPGLEAGHMGVSMSYHGPNTEMLVDSVHFVDCYHCYDGQGVGDMALGDGEVTNPEHGYLLGNSIALVDCTYEETTGRIIHSRHVNFHAALKTITAISAASPAVVTCTAHGFPDFTSPAIGVVRHPFIYCDQMVGSVELQGNVYEARWIDANSFALYNLDGTPVNGALLGAFVSGGCQRAQTGHIRLENNTIIQSGADANTDLYRYGADANQSLTEIQALGASVQQHLPGTASAAYETGTVINP